MGAPAPSRPRPGLLAAGAPIPMHPSSRRAAAAAPPPPAPPLFVSTPHGSRTMLKPLGGALHALLILPGSNEEQCAPHRPPSPGMYQPRRVADAPGLYPPTPTHQRKRPPPGEGGRVARPTFLRPCPTLFKTKRPPPSSGHTTALAPPCSSGGASARGLPGRGPAPAATAPSGRIGFGACTVLASPPSPGPRSP